MSKTIKEMAKEWGCSESTVRNYCASGIIPPAEKLGSPRRWRIPDEWPKPPMTRHGLCFLLDTVYQLNHGVRYSSLKWGYPDDEVKAGYDYSISSAFMSYIDTACLPEKLVDATVTTRGAELINRENNESKGKYKFKAHITTKVNVGIVSIEAGGEISNN